MKKLINKGFTMIEMLLSLLIISLSVSMIVNILPVLKKTSKLDNNIDFEMGFMQLREVLLLADEILFDEEELRFYYKGEDCSLIIDDNRIVKTDGYMIYLEGLEEAYFSKKGSCYYLNYEENNENKKRFLGCE